MCYSYKLHPHRLENRRFLGPGSQHFPGAVALACSAHYPQDMPDEIIDITRERFNRLDAKLDLILDGVRNLQVRVTSIEENMGAMNRRLDHMERAVDQIRKRLDLVEA